MEYKVDTCGLVIGLLDNYSEISSIELFEKEFKKNIFAGYKKDVEQYGGTIDKDLFRPVGYQLFGDYNMAILSLIDDFAFPNRVLHTGHGYSDDIDGKRKYSLQIINGIHTWIDGAPELHSLKEQAKATFLKVEDRYPFIGIVNYKINNGLLIGNGIELLELLKRKLYQLKGNVKYNIELICIDSFSNNELIVVYFAYELSSISFFTNETRILKLRDLADKDTLAQLEELAQNSLLYQSLSKQQEELHKMSILDQVKDAHIFATSFSHLGYDMQFSKCKLIKNELLSFQYQWDLKPGHYIDFKQVIINEKHIFTGNIEERIMPGTDMMQLIIKETTFQQFQTQLTNLNKEKLLQKYIRKQRINVIFGKHGMNRELRNSEEHPELMRRLRECGFSHDNLNQLRLDLDACRVSKVLKERTLKMYGTFNNGITDLLFFSYFIELKGYLEAIRKRISYYRKTISNNISLEDFHTWLNRMIRNFEQAYYNRFHHNSRMLNIADFNLEYNGGIQQLISAYDTAYKTILRKLINNEADDNCVYVSGYERVSSDKDSLRINISHITYPELYAATIWKEAINFYWDSTENNVPQNIHQINIQTNKRLIMDDDSIRMLKSRILYNKNYKPDSYVHTLMFNSINEAFIHYLMADAFVFKIGYMGDFDIFTFWYWHYFLQMSHFYNHEGEMRPEAFIKFLVRWLFIKHLAQEAAADMSEDYIAFDPKVAELWHCYINESSTFIDVLLSELEKFDFMNHVDAEAAHLQFLDLGFKDSLEKELTNDEITKSIEDYIHTLNDTLQEYATSFKNGKVILLQRKEDSDFPFIRNLMFCYLQSIKEMNAPYNKHTHVLERDNEGNILKQKQYCSILADSLGGMFIYNGTKRGEYFRLRSIFYKSLWGASFLIKKDYLKPLL